MSPAIRSGISRFTPTRVGTTNGRRAPGIRLPGSPPRAWGQHSALTPRETARRFTPTRVGTTTRFRCSSATCAVHPHARGDNIAAAGLGIAASGSPPRAWGQLRDRLVGGADHRFTPTRVGTTGRAVPGRAVQPVHPHARGDNSVVQQLCTGSDGSPPRAWGQRTPAPVDAAAGSVHPHARGDNCDAIFEQPRGHGSPPRAWGQPGREPDLAATGRFTPTRVGTTNMARTGCG